MIDHDDSLALLREIRDNQRAQLERQAEALDMQRRQFEMAREQLERAERLQGRAEALQGRAGKAVKFILWIAIPALVLVLMLMLWPYGRQLLA
jgi:hypothetical protein